MISFNTDKIGSSITTKEVASVESRKRDRLSMSMSVTMNEWVRCEEGRVGDNLDSLKALIRQ